MDRISDISFRDDVTVELVDSNTDDSKVAFAARVSTIGGRSLSSLASRPEKDKGLINYLMRERHGTPFEHSSMTFYIEAPLFVFREFHRHRVGWSYNEWSGRYSELLPTFYVPNKDRNLIQNGSAGHYEFASGTSEQFDAMIEEYRINSKAAYFAYKRMLDRGIAKEVARGVLPLNIYSSMYATCNPRSLMSFLSLRTKSELSKFPSYPQREIEMVAEKMENQWAKLSPIVWKAFNDNGRVSP